MVRARRWVREPLAVSCEHDPSRTLVIGRHVPHATALYRTTWHVLPPTNHGETGPYIEAITSRDMSTPLLVEMDQQSSSCV